MRVLSGGGCTGKDTGPRKSNSGNAWQVLQCPEQSEQRELRVSHTRGKGFIRKVLEMKTITD